VLKQMPAVAYGAPNVVICRSNIIVRRFQYIFNAGSRQHVFYMLSSNSLGLRQSR